MSISWGQVIGGVTAITGLAVAGVGLGGDSIASALAGKEGLLGDVGKFAGEAASKIGDVADSAAQAVGMKPTTIESLGGGEGIAAIVGGVAAVSGGLAMAFMGKSEEQKSQDQQLTQLVSMLPPDVKAQLIQALQIAVSEGAPPMPGGGKGRGLA